LFENHIPPAVEDDQAVVGNHFGWAVRDDVKNESVIEPVAIGSNAVWDVYSYPLATQISPEFVLDNAV